MAHCCLMDDEINFSFTTLKHKYDWPTGISKQSLSIKM